jgi:subtilisin family serine protease
MPSKIYNPLFFAVWFGANLVFAPLPASSAAPESVRPWRDLPAAHYRPGKIVIIPKAERAADLARFHRARGARVHKNFPGLRHTQVVDLPPGTDTLASVEAYQRSGLVEVAEPDILFKPALLPNDPALASGEQWPLQNTGQNGGLPGADISASDAWERFNSASNIIVAIIDSGARYTHQDLAANMWVNPGEIPDNNLDDDENGFIDDIHGINSVTDSGRPVDEIGHGTHVAGIIGAVGNNGLGTCGVAWRVKLMPLRFLSPGQLGSLADLLQCIDYARAKGARVLNCSFTTPIFSATMSNAFFEVRQAGIIVSAAAGNDGTDNDITPIYPASLKLDNIVSVTATTRGDVFSGYNYGLTSVHLAAPGSQIWSTYNRSDSDYALETGTSMAAPHVAGALALMRAHYPAMAPAQLIALLMASVDALPGLSSRCLSGGRLNLDRAVGPRDYLQIPAPYSWVPTNGLANLTLANNGISPALPLSFSFSFYGQDYTEVYVSANGMVGFTTNGLGSTADSPLPSPANLPNGALYPYWDDLNPSAGGQVWAGPIGLPPHRKFVCRGWGFPIHSPWAVNHFLRSRRSSMRAGRLLSNIRTSRVDVPR